MRNGPTLGKIAGYFILVLLAAMIVVSTGPSMALADGTGPTPPNDPDPPNDSTWTAVSVDQVDRAVNVDTKQEVSLWYIAQLLVLGVI